MFAILAKRLGDDTNYYLNHAYLWSLSFGPEEMAWTTDDKEKAKLMHDKVCSESKFVNNPDVESCEVVEL